MSREVLSASGVVGFALLVGLGGCGSGTQGDSGGSGGHAGTAKSTGGASGGGAGGAGAGSQGGGSRADASIDGSSGASGEGGTATSGGATGTAGTGAGTSGGGSTGTGGSADGGGPGAGGAGGGGVTGTGGTISSIDAGGLLLGPPVDCTGGVVADRSWSFGSTADAWGLQLGTGVQGTLSLLVGPGNLDPGALQVDVTSIASDTRAWVQLGSPQSNLAGHTARAAVWLDTDVEVWAKLFAQTNSSSQWIDGGARVVTPRIWNCFELVFDAPAYPRAPYTHDPNAVNKVGIELSCRVPFRAYLDNLSY